jgi:hypothetical protein
MSFQIELDPFDQAYAQFSSHVREAIRRTFEQEMLNGLTQREMAETLDVDEALISRRLNGPGNITLRTLSDVFVAMGREPLSNFVAPLSPPSVTVLSSPEMQPSTSVAPRGDRPIFAVAA